MNVPGTARQRMAVVAAAAVLVAAGGTTLALIGDEPAAPDDNVAFVEPAETAELLQQVGVLAADVFTIRQGKVAASRKRADQALIGSAVRTYDELYGPQLRLAAKEGLTLVTTIRSLGVIRLEGDQAEVLLFADQTATTRDGRSGTGAAQVSLRVEQSGGTWKISGIELL